MAQRTSPDSSGRDLYFHFLSYLAGALLWGFSIVNGSVKGLLLAAWTGELGNGTALKTKYTGLPFLDYPIGILVAFFFPGTSGQDEGYQLFVVDAFSAFAVAFVWLHVEASRPGPKPKWITRPAIWAVLWQLFGAAIILPLYYVIHLRWASQNTLPQLSNVDRARALTPAFLLGVVAPTAVVMAPTWVPRSAEAHQTIVTLFLLSPFWVSGIVMAATRVSAWFSSLSSSTTARRNKGAATWWVKAVHLQTALVSAAAHLYVMYRVFFDPTDPEKVDLARMYVPVPPNGPAGLTDAITSGSWLFLQFDHIIISLSSLSWALLLLEKTPLGPHLGKAALVLVLLIAALLVGPGATVSLALYFREPHLREDVKE
ncbi:hypothetical protein C8A03DRAFT_31310 [Achaetomium macrosporum]|uniref:Uncharacterized protein n=1 Tax=Achaetomium macrosporum TaxID=79813 RepID=A0AAN7HHE8_9PEZI|nr:hypothetical protein C8A03DRAFT_31310 [Achaetomium macrosporum]